MNEVDNEYVVFQQQMAAAAEADVQKKSMENFGGFTDTMPGEHDPVSPWLSKLPKNIGIGLIDAAVNASDQLGRLNNAIADKTGIPETAPDNKVDVAYNAMRQHVIDFRNGLAKNEGVADEMTHAVAQYAIPAMGFTKLIGGLQGANLLGTAGRVAAVEAATASTILDPHSQRFADVLSLARETEGRMGAAMNTLAPDGSLLNSYINWMTDRTNESDFEGTVKNVIDNIGMAGLTAGLFTTGAKALKMTWKLPGYVAESAGTGPVGLSAQKGMVGYHGTNRVFPPTPDNPLGEFDPAMIGSGTGGAAQGHGLYVAEAKGTANWYREITTKGSSLSTADLQKYFAPGAIRPAYAGNDRIINFDPKTGTVTVQAVVKDKSGAWITDSRWPHTRTHFTMPSRAEYTKVMGEPPSDSVGSLYHVDIPDEQVAKMLDWDKPLSQQQFPPAVARAIIAKVDNLKNVAKFRTENSRGLSVISDKTTGSDLYTVLAHDLGSQEAASKFLQDNGIPGIKYLDQRSRGKGEGTRNIVLFNPKLAKIIKKE